MPAVPGAPGRMPGFVADMDAAGLAAVPILLAMADRTGRSRAVLRPHDGDLAEGLEALRGQVDGVYCVLHGAGLTTADDPEGTMQALVREVLRDIPLVCQL